MRVAIVGTGAIGSLFLHALRPRAEVTSVSRSHFAGPLRTPSDVVFVAVKSVGTSWAAEIAARLLAERGICVTLQNGLGNLELLAASLGAFRTTQGLVYVGAELNPDGTLFQTGPGELVLGTPPSMPSWALALSEELAALLTEAGMRVELATDIELATWRKLIVNCAINPTSALFRLRSDELLRHGRGGVLADVLADEAASVARAIGLSISSESAIRSWRLAARATAGNRSSMFQDVDAERPTEVRHINGAVAKKAASVGLTAPLNDAMVVVIESIQRGRGRLPAADPSA